jgi:hypothetical protein
MESNTVSIRSQARIGVALVALTLWALSPAAAEDVENKFRLGLSVGGYNNQDEITSDSANVLTLVDEDQIFAATYVDPRNDSSVFGNLDINSGPIATFSAQYAATKTFIIEGSIGYNKNDVGDIEVQAQFAGTDVPDLRRFDFRSYRIPAGTLTRVPVQLTAMARFRPRASFNPYVGAGIGYSFLGFEPSSELDELSLNMDASLGGQARLTQATFGAPQMFTPGQEDIRDMEGATVLVEDTFEWHVAGGAELSFKRKWAMFLDLRWSFASRSIEFLFDNSGYVGVPVPQLTDFEDSDAGRTTYGAFWITTGGLIDGGSLQWRPREGQPPGTNCSGANPDPQRCVQAFDFSMPDGVVDRGFYYVQGGTVDIGGLALQIGVRYTF